MKRSILLFVCLFCAASPLSAAIQLDPLLNKVTLELKAEQWVTTQTALVSVNVNAAVSDQNIANIQNDVLEKLKQLGEGDWHIVNFAREQDQSGLENVQISAQARLPQASLANLRTKAKTMSKPGETYTVDTVDFVPSDDEIRQANSALRSNIYQQVKNEIDALNKVYPDQKFYVHYIDFVLNTRMPNPQPMYMKVAGLSSVAHGAPTAAAAPLNVGNKNELNARVTLASMPDVMTKQVAATQLFSNNHKPQ